MTIARTISQRISEPTIWAFIAISPYWIPSSGPPLAARSDRQESGRRRRDKGVVVDVGLDPFDAPLRGLTDRFLKRAKQRSVSLGVMERLARRVERRHAALRQEESHRTLHLVDPRAHPITDRAVLLLSRPHERDVGVVNHEAARGEPVGDGVARPKVHHVHRAN